MKCPYCGNPDTRVIDSRPAEDNSSIRRRRSCDECGKRFTTYEKVETIPLIVIKKDNNRKCIFGNATNPKILSIANISQQSFINRLDFRLRVQPHRIGVQTFALVFKPVDKYGIIDIKGQKFYLPVCVSGLRLPTGLSGLQRWPDSACWNAEPWLAGAA